MIRTQTGEFPSVIKKQRIFWTNTTRISVNCPSLPKTKSLIAGQEIKLTVTGTRGRVILIWSCAFSMQTLELAIGDLNLSKSPGPDGIYGKMIMHLDEQAKL
ncbi:hypothetical protein TNCV_360601 [Trichonephila clavipes]|nr:hypothetical protein TNCV_360601 [Trichonephila clavipes]